MIALVVALSLGISAQPNAPPPPWATGESKGEDLAIDLVLFGPGLHDVTSWFGHTALVVRDRRLKAERLYNYGEFSFDRLMLARYASGHLEFWVGERPVQSTLRIYERENRTVTSLHLALAPEERLAVARALADNALPENKRYLYDHYTDNCATKPRDVLDAALGGRLRAASAPGRGTLREHTLRHTFFAPPLGWLIDFMLNDEVDRPISTWEESFLPAELVKNVRAAGLVRSETVHSANGPVARAAPPVMTPLLFALGCTLGIVTVLLARRRRALAWWSAIVGGLAAVPGTILFALWAFTDHFITYRNENILLSSPITLLAAVASLLAAVRFERPLGDRAAKLARLAWAALAGACVVALVLQAPPMSSLFDQVNAPHLALFVPFVCALAIAWRRAWRTAPPS